MCNWIEMLSDRVNSQTDPGKTTPKTPETHPNAGGTDSFGGFGGDFSGACSENSPDRESVVERGAIMEYDGDLDRDRANLRAAKLYDDSRQRLQGDPSTAAMLYREYIRDWKPEDRNDLPACPPNFAGNVELWRAWWAQVETRHV